MAPLILGGVALVVILILLGAFVNVDPKLLVRGLRYYGTGLLLLAAVALAVMEKFAFALLATGLALAVFTRGRIWLLPGPFGFFGFFSRGRPRQTRGSTTRVRTEWVEMILDHDSGAMTGRVLKGAHAGHDLDALTEGETIELFLMAGRDDAETGNLLSAYLDRKYGSDWHDKARRAGSSNGAGRPDSGMSRAEAFSVLGLGPGADEDAIRAAHRALMLKNHPDVGGSSEAAARINEAKDVLLRK